MATKKNQDQGTDVLDEVSSPDSSNGTTDSSAEGSTEKRSKEEIDAEIKAAQEMIKALKAEAKGEKPKKERVIKGRMVAFKNKAGQVITGMGQLYYVARHGGRLHYKEASQVVFLPEGWKEGDPIPALPGDEAAKTDDLSA